MTTESEFKPHNKLDHQWQPKKFYRTKKEFHPTKNRTYPSQETKDETSTSRETTVTTFTEESVAGKI